MTTILVQSHSTQYTAHGPVRCAIRCATMFRLPNWHLLLGATVLLSLMNLGRPPMVGAGRWWFGSQSPPLLLPMAWVDLAFASPVRGPTGELLPFSTHPPFRLVGFARGPPGKSCVAFHFSLIFWGPSGPAPNMEGHEAQHASLAAHTVRVRNREQRSVRLSSLGQS